MNREEGIYWLEQLRRRWQVSKLLSLTLLALGAGMLVTGLAAHFMEWPWLAGIPAFILTGALLIWQQKIFTTDNGPIVRYLDAAFPELEESASLLLKPADTFNLLERLQTGRVVTQLKRIAPEQAFPFRWKLSLSWLVGLGLVGLLAAWLPINTKADKQQRMSKVWITTPANPEVSRIAQVKAIRVTIAPPAYTGKGQRQQTSPHILAEAGAKISWRIATDYPAKQVQLVFNGKNTVIPRLVSDEWMYQETFTANAFYQVRVNNKLSEYYRIEIAEDKPPVVTVTAPQSYTEIVYGKPTDVRVNVNLQDDYGLTAAYLVVTVAQGNGEAVKFKEEKLLFGNSPKISGTTASLSRLLSLAQMDMVPGDELYFYVEASDTHAQSSRSDMCIISLQDTAQATLADAMTMGINPVPEYFRSQRQIIIDTEKLLKQQARLSKDDFGQRSNGIGIDQKVLRLRYGKFLGEEFEDMIGEIAGKEELIGQGHYDGDGHDHSSDLHGLEAFVHNHDESDEATFLEPAIKIKLKACLAEMWEAELHLRTYQPKAALPYEYKALKLLKEVQQSSRSYVAKTGFGLPPLKPHEKRLTGELDKIIEPIQKREREAKVDFPAIRLTQSLLHKLRESDPLSSTEIAVLEKAGNELSGEAVRQPGRYLQALGDLRKIMEAIKQQKKELCKSCLATVEKAFWAVLPPAEKLPASQRQASGKLGEMYLEKL